MPEMRLHVNVCKHSFEHWGKVPGSTQKSILSILLMKPHIEKLFTTVL